MPLSFLGFAAALLVATVALIAGLRPTGRSWASVGLTGGVVGGVRGTGLWRVSGCQKGSFDGTRGTEACTIAKTFRHECRTLRVVYAHIYQGGEKFHTRQNPGGN